MVLLKQKFFPIGYVRITSERKVNLQVDGKYSGKLNEVKATTVANAPEIMVPGNEIIAVHKIRIPAYPAKLFV